MTDKAGPSDDSPFGLPVLLLRPTPQVHPSLRVVAADIADQLGKLGPVSTEEVRQGELLWAHHDEELLRQASQGVSTELPGPADVLRTMRESPNRRWCKRRVRHGDLHLGNVSLDESGGIVRAFLIDPGFMNRGFVGRDLAALEVSLLLHQRYEGAVSLVAECVDMFGIEPLEEGVAPALPPGDHHRNTRLLLQAIHEEARKECDPLTYVIMLIDEVLIQLGGLSFGTSQNKIFRSADAIELFGALCRWYQRLGSGDLFNNERA